MYVISDMVCGMDVYKKSIMVCVLLCDEKEFGMFGMVKDDLFVLFDWMRENGCMYVVMESIGMYWKCIYNMLEMEENLWVYVVNV